MRDPNKKDDDVDKEVQNTLKLSNLLPIQPLPGDGIDIAILDTWPMSDYLRPLDRIREFRRTLDLSGVYNPAINDFAEGRIVPEGRIHDLVTGVDLSAVPCFHHDANESGFEPSYDLPDHGLFVTYLVHDVAPGAEISIYRVMNDHGHTDVATVANAVRLAIARARDRKRRLIINLSLGFGAPFEFIPDVIAHARTYNRNPRTYLQLYERVEKQGRLREQVDGYRKGPLRQYLAEQGLLDGDQSRPRFSGVLAALDQLFGFDVDQDQDVLAIAAAGNDSVPGYIFGPRLPAAVEGVLGVSARDAAGKTVPYSNAEDVLNPNEDIMDDGIGALGGLVDAETGFSKDTLFGPYISPYPPAKRNPNDPYTANTTGWAQWSGTSFATPIVSGFAACLWAQAPAMTARELLDLIVGKPGGGNGPGAAIRSMGAGSGGAGGRRGSLLFKQQEYS